MSIVLEQLTKRYEGHPVVNQVSLEVADGEFFVLLGPSGSGKSTILRMIAGLVDIDEGRISLHGRDVTQLPPQQRGVGFVFQHYALFHHMSVAQNVEFALSIRKVAKAERRQRRDELLELVGLAGLGERMPSQLSGGQQQRVALARALAHRPDVLLLDEPFGALDAKIRVDLRRALRNIQLELGITTIFVTHDQEEAFELADRLGVMNFGRLLEVGPPEELYQRPQTEFVATFLGTANLMVGQATPSGVQVGPLHFPLSTQASQLNHAHRVQVLFRTEDVALAASPEALGCPQLGQGEVEHTTFSGSFEKLRLRLPPLPGVRPINPPVAFGGGLILVDATRSQDHTHRFPLKPGDKVWVGVRRIHALVHPGLSFLILTDGSPQAQAALAVGGQIARMAHARVTLLGYDLADEALQRHLQEAKEQLGSGLAALDVRATSDAVSEAVRREVERQPYDLIVLGFQPRGGIDLAEELLQSGEHHLLLVPKAQPALTRALICVASGEPGKDDVLFAGRLVRHLGAEATLLSVLPASSNKSANRERAARFLSGGIRSLEVLGVPAQMKIRIGTVRDEIVDEVHAGKYDLLVLGAPLPDRAGRASLDKLVEQVLAEMPDRITLIVRSHYTSSVPLLTFGNRANILEEVIV
ncbi:MAG TPA: ATP-binding cassette domain-containing protein [Anaerolineae bacterium]|nr:ATP-binding cassette domain-containing protein [Anaerolineae bacterium]